MADEINILINETLKQLENKTREQAVEALKKDGLDDENIKFILDGKLTKSIIKKTAKQGRIGEQEILLATTESGEILKNVLASKTPNERVKILVSMGLDEEFANRVALAFDELKQTI